MILRKICNTFLGLNIGRNTESCEQSLPHRLLFPNEYNQIAPLANPVRIADREDENISIDGSDEEYASEPESGDFRSPASQDEDSEHEKRN